MTGLVLRDRGRRLSIRIERRAVAVTVALAGVLTIVVCLTLTTGDFELSIGEVLQSLTGNGSAGADFIVNTVRMPRLLTALFVGAALAVSGAILQRLSANPLGSPDIIGFTNGSTTGALIVIVVLQGSMTQIVFGALIGGLATAVAVYLLAFTKGQQGFRLVVIGIGVSALLLAVNSYLITRASLHDALEAQAWLIGSLNNRRSDDATAIGLAVAILLPIALAFARRLSMLEMGDDTASALGVNVRRSRSVLLFVSVALAAFATSVTGPILFVALAAPQISQRLIGSSGAGLLPAALTGATLLAASDLAVQRIFAPALIPVGTATGTIGGLYLIWLLVTQSRRSRA